MARRLNKAAKGNGSRFPPPYYLKRLVVRNARCFADVDLSFMKDHAPRMKTVIVGENGHGKTSLLRAIAIGLCQQRKARPAPRGGRRTRAGAGAHGADAHGGRDGT